MDKHYEEFIKLYNEYVNLIDGNYSKDKQEEVKKSKENLQKMRQKASKIKPISVKMNIGKPIDKKKEFSDKSIKELI